MYHPLHVHYLFSDLPSFEICPIVDSCAVHVGSLSGSHRISSLATLVLSLCPRSAFFSLAMNPSSTPIPRTRPVEKRESLLRASILDTALELGVGTSQAVTQWMFSPIGEDDEERDVRIA